MSIFPPQAAREIPKTSRVVSRRCRCWAEAPVGPYGTMWTSVRKVTLMDWNMYNLFKCMCLYLTSILATLKVSARYSVTWSVKGKSQAFALFPVWVVSLGNPLVPEGSVPLEKWPRWWWRGGVGKSPCCSTVSDGLAAEHRPLTSLGDAPAPGRALRPLTSDTAWPPEL